MALTDVQHVEAVALINSVLDHAPSLPPEIRRGAEGWLGENHPPPEAYSAAMRALAGQHPARSRDWVEGVVAHLQEDLDRIEVIENDGRHLIGHPWLVVRGWTRALPSLPPGRVYLGKARKPRIRRLYAHPSGYIAEGGRGGARVFFVTPGSTPLRFGFLDSAFTVIRAESLGFAAEIVEALSGERR